MSEKGTEIERVAELAVIDAGATSTPGISWKRIAVGAVVSFAAFLVVGNGLILASTWYFQTVSPDRGPEVAVDNFEQIDSHVYRGAAPNKAALRQLSEAGVTTVVDLRAEADLVVDDSLYGELGLTRHTLPIRDGQLPTQAQTAAFLEILDQADGEVFLHCGAGVGRTGAMTAFYLNATGQAHGAAALRRILAVGPPSLEQMAFALTTTDGAYHRPNEVVTALSRVLDGPRRIWHNIT